MQLWKQQEVVSPYGAFLGFISGCANFVKSFLLKFSFLVHKL